MELFSSEGAHQGQSHQEESLFRGLLSGQVRRPIGWMVRVIRIIVGKSPDGWYASTSVRGFLRRLLRFLAEVWLEESRVPGARPCVSPVLSGLFLVLTGVHLCPVGGWFLDCAIPARFCLAEKKTPARDFPGRRSCCFHVVQAVVVCLWFVLLLSFCRICCEKDKNG